MTDQIATNTSKITCLCGAVTEPGNSLIVEHFPIAAGFCSCGICRHSTGTLGTILVQLKGRPLAESLARCRTFAATDRAKRYFCSTCGSHMFIQHSQTENWFALGGAVDRSDTVKEVDTLHITKIGFLGETGDGGIAGRLRAVALHSEPAALIDCYAGLPVPGTKVPLRNADQLWRRAPTSQEQDTDKVTCGCQCGNVRFDITWPNAARNDLSGVSRWLRSNQTKYRASFCVCRWCRLATGTPFTPWTYVMPENIVTESGQPVDLGFHTKLDKLKGAQVYYSSADSKRSFCATCGATLFYECEDRPQVVDIGIGLLRSSTGVLAEDILEWDWSLVSWREDGQNHSFLEHLIG